MVPMQGCGFVLLATSLIGTCLAALKAGCQVETLRACGEEHLPYGNGLSQPVSGKPLADKCTTWKRELDCGSQFYIDCYEGLPQVAGLVVAKQLKEIYGSICHVGSELNKEYEKVTPCLNTVRGKLHSCFANLKSDLHKALVQAPAEHIIPHVCCSYDDAVHCFDDSLGSCESVGGKRHFLGILDRVFGNVLNLACPGHVRGSEACNALAMLPPVGPNDRQVGSYAEVFTGIAAQLGN